MWIKRELRKPKRIGTKRRRRSAVTLRRLLITRSDIPDLSRCRYFQRGGPVDRKIGFRFRNNEIVHILPRIIVIDYGWHTELTLSAGGYGSSKTWGYTTYVFGNFYPTPGYCSDQCFIPSL